MEERIKELHQKVEEINRRRFFLAMKDWWSRKDFEADDKMSDEIFELEKEIKELEKKQAAGSVM